MIFIALGANLPSSYGQPHETLAAAITAIGAAGDIDVLAESSVWLTAPVPVSDQPWYHNAVISVDTDLSPFALLERLQDIENEFGRVRSVRNAPRLIDLDLVAFDDVILDKPELIVPHPRLHQRAFVLLPLQEIAPDWVHPLSGDTVDEIIAEIPADQSARKMS
ncbi:MAG: 2-amino-4-hydroxy-6-hydroxymethyldihydropteridine diphosphokinase [Alphaproteobacteria bacterium]|nr:2-amino-4-hydroxy-6-hydroxymethyldihydropteridine diphosphokinase [Alphaproteobacteria bacterium]MBU0859553.1 2-amino-4-hydroxy-6-hydroxymethyldihydropteridine diphosphokinase [Alphaproteobacteria bacterium]